LLCQGNFKCLKKHLNQEDGDWWEFNDTSVLKKNPIKIKKHLNNSSVKVLFYQKLYTKTNHSTATFNSQEESGSKLKQENPANRTRLEKPYSQSNTEMKDETMKLVTEPRQEMRQELKQELRQELRQELKQELRQELKQELRQELKQELRQELKKELKKELKQELKKELKQELMQELLRRDIRFQRYST